MLEQFLHRWKGLHKGCLCVALPAGGVTLRLDFHQTLHFEAVTRAQALQTKGTSYSHFSVERGTASSPYRFKCEGRRAWQGYSTLLKQEQRRY